MFLKIATYPKTVKPENRLLSDLKVMAKLMTRKTSQILLVESYKIQYVKYGWGVHLLEELKSILKERQYWIFKLVLGTHLVVRIILILENLVILCKLWKMMLQKENYPALKPSCSLPITLLRLITTMEHHIVHNCLNWPLD